MSAPHLLETMRAENGRIALLDRHLGRLETSAEHFGYPVRIGKVRERLARATPRDRVLGLRLTVGPDGRARVESWPLDGVPFRTAWLDVEPLAEAGTLLCTHKTTARAHYRARYERALAIGADEAVLVNAQGEVTEGTRTNVWAEIDGRWWTPPLAAGGLGGVMRAHLLETRSATGERRLSAPDLRAASAVALSNALRGWMPVRILETGRQARGAPPRSGSRPGRG